MLFLPAVFVGRGTMADIWKLAHAGDLGQVKQHIADDKSCVTNTSECGRMLIHWAASGGHYQLVHLLLEHHSPVDTADDAGWSPLIIAASAGGLSIVELLLTRGASVDHVTNTGQSALIYAASKNHVKIVELLLRHGASAARADRYGITALHRASCLGHVTVIQQLLAVSGIDGSTCLTALTDKHGNTPLHLACEDQQTESCRILVEAGASISCVNSDEKTPLDLATPKVAKFLHQMALQAESRQQ